MHLSALKAFSLQPALATSGNQPGSVSSPEPNIYSLTASLCTTYELSSISGLYNLFQETAWMGKGPDLTHASLFDIVMDKSLNTSAFIKCFQSSKVPHSTTYTCTRIRSSTDFRSLQDIYYHLLDQRQWNPFTSEGHVVLEC